MRRGWVAVWRQMLDPSHDLFGDNEPVCKALAWIDLVGLAEWRNGEDLDRGCFQHANEYLRRRWNWPTKSKVHRFLKRLIRHDRIVKEADGEAYHDPSIYRIVNYDQYQFEPGAYPERPAERQPERPTERQTPGSSGEEEGARNDQRNDNRNDNRNGSKEVIRSKEEQTELMGDGSSDRFPHPNDLPKDGGQYVYPTEFEVWWEVYPERRGSNSKIGAYRKWRSTVLDGVRPDRLYEAALKYRSHLESEGQVGTPYVKQAKTFLGPDEHWRQAWDDQPDPESEPNRKMRNDFRRRVDLLDRMETR